MRVEIIETSSLGDRSYVVVDGHNAVVVDPQRDIDRVSELGARITHVLETHLHNDYVTGGLELSRTTGAEYVLPAGDDTGYPARRISDGEVVDGGTFSLRAIHTPGHTREHISYALEDASGTPVGVFTGGSMLYDSTGRTDLLGDDSTRELTAAQYHSVRRLATELPAETDVYPTHASVASARRRRPAAIRRPLKSNATPIPRSPRTSRGSSTTCSRTCPTIPPITNTWV